MKKILWNEIAPFQEAEKSPGSLLWEVSLKWRKEVEKVLSSLGITHSQFVLLAAIGWLTRNGQKVTQIEVSRYSNTDIATTSQIFRTFEQKELTETRQSIGDERSKVSKLTERGIQMVQKGIVLIQGVDQEFFGDRSEASINLLKELND